MKFALTVNGKARTVEAPGDKPLLWVLREELALSGPKFGCGQGLCGACTVLLDGEAVRSCSTPLSAVGKAKVTTIEGVGATAVGQRLRAAWVDLDVPQCGYCQAGQIMSAASLLAANPRPDDAAIDAAMSGNLCRCGTYHRIRAAIHQAAAGGTRRAARDGETGHAG
ncbi:(2Fe-2S)-binding protein [Novosphingobium piscinae]|uniref:(2Fe-2S)-binding protein n=1 Tax=Novosphingobium piscinae TaxID=1507448 RepID=A0A7X1FWB5_9SPHN|nr:(2Fe-2S)-binding protein [Novosphingobium piscinae]MBC2667562.1 (2Fe-2S)-binding protein [Novosphingobium piscinae]